MHEVHRIVVADYVIYVDRSYDRVKRAHVFDVLLTQNGIVQDREGPFGSKAEAVECAAGWAAEIEDRISALVGC